ncbi:long-chain-fatty-acid--CoA ligase [Pyrobaculum aerophilum str. IM2]|uniref:Long-chain-fatty-acid--CoA ligase n=3 Tax=Pyrobaculum TaxID=2276 RepID=Q8ZV41_PYRAE|nr:class I adenylate-forming enzyme family protein [Pyrobaculum aerophilum]AAL64215.1 long-chain-fatty-acid--CoA ligase [Pyrobaculum aerophilum str. IM2]HII47025.1 acyl--CoA ligase [Pyrobaculum aerophilum]
MKFWSVTLSGKLAICEGESCLTYRELFEKATKWALNSRVVFAARNSLWSYAALMGLLHGGGEVALVDPLTVSEDLKMIIEDFSPDLIVGDEEFLQQNAEVLKNYKTLSVNSPPNGGGWTYDTTFVMYYAGIAGRTMQVLNKTSSLWINAHSLALAMGLEKADVVYVTAPITHVLGLVTSMAALAAGGMVRLMKKLSPNVVEELSKATVIVGAPAFYAEVLKIGVGKLGAKFAVSGGAYLAPDLRARFEEVTGVRILQVYGLTEGLVLTFEPPSAYGKGSVGAPLPLVEIRLLEDGELAVKAPWVMRGYKDPEETKRAFIDGWLRTGDILEEREGLLYFKGVKKRMIKYKGYPIFPRDLEEILKRHPAVLEAKVVGELHPEYGEVPVAYIKVKGEVSEENLLNFINSQVAFYKRLKKIYIERI